jgi:predicted dehydrogenase
VSDLDPARARALGDQTGADVCSGSNDEIIERPEVSAVIVSTPEGEHAAPVKKALKLGKAVLVEKPLALSLRDADDVLEALARTKGDLRVAYSRRYKDCFLRAKEQVAHGRLGAIAGGTARVYNSRAVASNILKRDPHATPVLDVLTYYVDLVCWFMEGIAPAEVVARGRRGMFTGAGYDADDVTWAILTFADGAVFSLGVSYSLPPDWPGMGQCDRVELLGREGTMIVDDDHLDHLLYTEKGFPAGYLPNHAVKMAFLGANSGGDWALGDFWGSIANETRAWLDSLAMGTPSVHTTAHQARVNLETTLAIVKAAQTGKPVKLPLE